MSRKLLKQIRNEWTANVWLALELLVVSVVLWFIMDQFYVNYRIATTPLGYDVEHCYKLSFNDVTDKNPSYIPNRTSEEELADIKEILNRMQHHPIVEAASISNNSHPYNGSNSGAQVWHDTIMSSGYCIRRWVTPDFVRVFRYQGTRGETPEQLAQMLRERKFLVSDRLFRHHGVSATDLVGEKFCVEDSTVVFELGAALVGPRYYEYNTFDDTEILNMENESWNWGINEFCIRVKPEMDKDVVETLMGEAESLFHVGNKLLVNVTSFDDIRRAFNQSQKNSVMYMKVGLGFLLLNVFLGLFGTFWFRTQQRVSEIAIRKSMGASRWDISRRLISEGLLLLLIVTPFAFIIDCILTYFEFNAYYEDNSFPGIIGRVALCAAVSATLIAVMIVAGIWFPATKAEKINPAIALKDE